MSSEWTTRALGDLCHIELGKTPERKRPDYWDAKKETDNVWLSIADLPLEDNAVVEDSKEYVSNQGAELCKLVKKGTLLVSFKLTLGRLAYAGRDLMTNEAIAALTIKDKSTLLQTYLYWYLRHFDWDKAAEGDVKIKGKTLNKAKLKKIKVLVPPIEEQQRIVAFLDEAFAGIATATVNAEKNLQNARELFESTLQSVFAEKGEGWETKKLEDIVEESCSLSYGIVQPGVYVDGGLPVVRPTDLTNKVIQLDGLKRIDPELATSYSRTTLQGGDLLLCVRGSTGTVSLAAKELSGANVTRGIVPIRFESTVMNNEFGYYQLISKFVQDQIKAGTYGAALMQINIRDLRKVEVKVPPLDVQKELTQKLDSLTEDVGRLESTYKEKLAALTELKQSILQKAFAGELH